MRYSFIAVALLAFFILTAQTPPANDTGGQPAPATDKTVTEQKAPATAQKETAATPDKGTKTQKTPPIAPEKNAAKTAEKAKAKEPKKAAPRREPAKRPAAIQRDRPAKAPAKALKKDAAKTEPQRRADAKVVPAANEKDAAQTQRKAETKIVPAAESKISPDIEKSARPATEGKAESKIAEKAEAKLVPKDEKKIGPEKEAGKAAEKAARKKDEKKIAPGREPARRIVPARQNRKKDKTPGKDARKKDRGDKADKKEDKGILNPLESLNTKLVEVANSVMPSVVSIQAIRTVTDQEYRERSKAVPRDPYAVVKEPNKILFRGSGIVYDDKGHILTNHHLLLDSKDIRVTLSDKREFRASLVGSDPATDIAVLKLVKVPDKLPVIAQGDSEKVRSGEMVIAVGRSLGIPHTVAIGVVSGLTRQHPGLAEYEYFLQTDAPINSGNSGGALINIRGELVGINTAVVSPAAAFRGAGLAVPRNMAQKIADDLIAKGKIVRGWIGVYLQPVTTGISSSLGYDKEGGVLVTAIAKGSSAEKADIRSGDIITKIDTIDIADMNHFRRLIAWKKPGEKAALTLFRTNASLDITADVEAAPDRDALSFRERISRRDDLGITVKDLDEELAYRYKIRGRSGVVVTEVRQDSPAFVTGLRVGDAIIEINKTPIENTGTYKKVMVDSVEQKQFLLFIRRMGVNHFKVLQRAD